MFLKAIVTIAVLGVCYGAEEKHAYSSQSFVRYDNHKAEHHVPVKVAVPVKAVAPVVTKVVVPVAHYVSQGHGQSQQGQSQQGHSSHHAATSSQHIQRHDVPGKAPADYHEHYGHPKYEFEYKVEDPHTGDNKYQHESRDGDVVKGVYSLHEADGSIRTVEYSANKHTGFIANVKHSTKHIQPKHHN